MLLSIFAYKLSIVSIEIDAVLKKEHQHISPSNVIISLVLENTERKEQK